MSGFGAKKQYSDTHKAISAVIGVMLFFLLLFSAFYVTEEMNHDCAGEDCPICACIAQCERHIRQLGSGAPLTVVLLSAVVFLVRLFVCEADVLPPVTPVSRKVRLNP